MGPAHGLVWDPEGPKLVYIYPSPTTLAPPEMCLAPPGPTAQNTLAPPLIRIVHSTLIKCLGIIILLELKFAHDRMTIICRNLLIIEISIRIVHSTFNECLGIIILLELKFTHDRMTIVYNNLELNLQELVNNRR